jgi:23S rRNA (cytidine1920-2'-O)/16S rRNA (cytidine1409-2'-O)-methyltransferase
VATRLDHRLVELGHARSRSQAHALIKAGCVSVDGAVILKPSHPCFIDALIAVAASDLTRFASRGGLKLARALERTHVNPAGYTVLDMGQSTGGFTDCLLQAGAAKVVGVDVGRDQLVQTLREDPRVVCLEGINGRALPVQDLLSHTVGQLGFDLIVMDVSFISQTLIIPALQPLLNSGGQLLSLVKPQFELQPEHIGKNGLVKSAKFYPQVEERIRACLSENGFKILEYFDSGIEGGDGNREFFVLTCKLN